MAGLATGLTALIGALADQTGVDLPEPWRAYVHEQRQEVAERQRHFRAALPAVLRALAAADVQATPVKGAVLASLVWPYPDCRPMADIDLIIDGRDRGRARGALEAAGLGFLGTAPWEDTYLAWGDGAVGRTDGESAAHNGKVELHPGWVERLHNYLVDDRGVVTARARPGSLFGAACLLLPPSALAAQALGHLSASVIRAEARAVNLIDVVLLLSILDAEELGELRTLTRRLDGRLTYPALWLIDRYQPGLVSPELLATSRRRVGERIVARLGVAREFEVWRAFGTRTDLRWRAAFTSTPHERVAMLRQYAWPAGASPIGRLRRAARRRPSPARRVVYVIHADAGDVAPVAVLERWPTASRTVAAVAANGTFDVSAVARTRGHSEALVHDGVPWRFVRDPSRTGWRMAREVARLRPDVIHVNGLHAALPTLALRVACGSRVRIVAQHHGESPGRGRSLLAQRAARRWIDGYLFTGVDGQSEPWREARVLHYSTPTFEVLESSADFALLDRASARGVTGVVGNPAIMWVGRLIGGKDPMTAVEAFARLGQPHDAHLWMMYADASLEPMVRTLIETTPGLRERVHLVGTMPHASMAAWFSSGDIVLSTSRREGSGYALIEALACGCTPVVTDIAPHRAIAGSLGARFPVGDVDACAMALRVVIRNAPTVVRADFERRLSWRAVGEQLIRAYES